MTHAKFASIINKPKETADVFLVAQMKKWKKALSMIVIFITILALT